MIKTFKLKEMIQYPHSYQIGDNLYCTQYFISNMIIFEMGETFIIDDCVLKTGDFFYTFTIIKIGTLHKIELNLPYIAAYFKVIPISVIRKLKLKKINENLNYCEIS